MVHLDVPRAGDGKASGHVAAGAAGVAAGGATGVGCAAMAAAAASAAAASCCIAVAIAATSAAATDALQLAPIAHLPNVRYNKRGATTRVIGTAIMPHRETQRWTHLANFVSKGFTTKCVHLWVSPLGRQSEWRAGGATPRCARNVRCARAPRALRAQRGAYARDPRKDGTFGAHSAALGPRPQAPYISVWSPAHRYAERHT